jgi:hypothetical protein
LQSDLFSLLIQPLTRPITSLGDETVADTTVDPNISNVTYARPYLVSLPTSINDGKLTLLASSSTVGVNGSPTNLGNLSPAAGGNTSFDDNLGALSPSAGGSIAGGPSGINCGNAYLDHKWLDDPHLAQCTEKGQSGGIFAGLRPSGIPDLSPSAGGNPKLVCVKYATHKHHRALAGGIVKVNHHQPIAHSNKPVKDPCIEYKAVQNTSNDLAAATPVTATK